MSPDENPQQPDETEWTPSDDPTDYPEFWEDSDSSPAADIIDKVLGGEASDAKSAIYAALYGKVGERIDSLRSELSNGAIDLSSEVDETPTDDLFIDGEQESEEIDTNLPDEEE
jgi:hypothetical protein